MTFREGQPKPPSSGRRQGIPNRRTSDVAARLEALGCDPIEGMARLAMGKIPCRNCDGRGDVEERTPCPACSGTGTEVVCIETRARMYAELAHYVAPKRKAVELRSDDGGPLLVTTIHLRGPPKPI